MPQLITETNYHQAYSGEISKEQYYILSKEELAEFILKYFPDFVENDKPFKRLTIKGILIETYKEK